jgi:hypothetical protein
MVDAVDSLDYRNNQYTNKEGKEGRHIDKGNRPVFSLHRRDVLEKQYLGKRLVVMRDIFEGMRMANHHAFLDMGMHIKHHATVVPHEQQRQHPLDIVCASPKHTIFLSACKDTHLLKNRKLPTRFSIFLLPLHQYSF